MPKEISHEEFFECLCRHYKPGSSFKPEHLCRWFPELSQEQINQHLQNELGVVHSKVQQDGTTGWWETLAPKPKPPPAAPSPPPTDTPVTPASKPPNTSTSASASSPTEPAERTSPRGEKKMVKRMSWVDRAKKLYDALPGESMEQKPHMKLSTPPTKEAGMGSDGACGMFLKHLSKKGVLKFQGDRRKGGYDISFIRNPHDITPDQAKAKPRTKANSPTAAGEKAAKTRTATTTAATTASSQPTSDLDEIYFHAITEFKKAMWPLKGHPELVEEAFKSAMTLLDAQGK